jgi:hypothetical protein
MESVSVKIPDINASHGASYALREALVDVPLTELGNGQDASVTCAEFWGEQHDHSGMKISHDSLQTTTSMSAPLPAKCFTMFSFQRILLLQTQASSWRRDCSFRLLNQHGVRLALSKFSFYHSPGKRAFYVMVT